MYDDSSSLSSIIRGSVANDSSSFSSSLLYASAVKLVSNEMTYTRAEPFVFS